MASSAIFTHLTPVGGVGGLRLSRHKEVREGTVLVAAPPARFGQLTELCHEPVAGKRHLPRPNRGLASRAARATERCGRTGFPATAWRLTKESPVDKNVRQKYGINGKAVKVVKLYRKGMDFDHAETRENPGTGAWIGVTPDGKMVQAQTYSGNLGRNYSPQLYDLPDQKSLDKRLKAYTPVTEINPTDGSDCFEIVDLTTGTEPKDDAEVPNEDVDAADAAAAANSSAAAAELATSGVDALLGE